MKTIKFHCEYRSFGSEIRIGLYVEELRPIICASFVENCLEETPSQITVWVKESKNGNIVIAKPREDKAVKWIVPSIGWKWHGERKLSPVLFTFSLKVKPGRYNIYISEGWI